MEAKLAGLGQWIGRNDPGWSKLRSEHVVEGLNRLLRKRMVEKYLLADNEAGCTGRLVDQPPRHDDRLFEVGIRFCRLFKRTGKKT